jgi:hypothetical protein
MSLLDNAVAHFSGVDATLHKVHVDEWDGDVWFKASASMSGVQYNKFQKYIQQADYEALVEILILRARNEDGTKMFTGADRKTLMYRVSPDVVNTVVTNMFAVDTQENDAVKK